MDLKKGNLSKCNQSALYWKLYQKVLDPLQTAKFKNSENVPNLEIIEVLLVHCVTVNKDYQ